MKVASAKARVDQGGDQLDQVDRDRSGSRHHLRGHGRQGDGLRRLRELLRRQGRPRAHLAARAAPRAKVNDVVKEGDKVKVKLLGFDDRGKTRLSMKVVDQATGEDLEAKQKAEGDSSRRRSRASNPQPRTAIKRAALRPPFLFRLSGALGRRRPMSRERRCAAGAVSGPVRLTTSHLKWLACLARSLVFVAIASFMKPLQRCRSRGGQDTAACSSGPALSSASSCCTRTPAN